MKFYLKILFSEAFSLKISWDCSCEYSFKGEIGAFTVSKNFTPIGKPVGVSAALNVCLSIRFTIKLYSAPYRKNSASF